MSKSTNDILRKLRDDFTYYAPRALKIKPKVGHDIPFTLNKPQLYVHERLEAQRKRTGKVRAIVVKGRQQGISTYIEGRFMWQSNFVPGTRTFILTHRSDATQNLFGMTRRYHENLPDAIKPRLGTNNANELNFVDLGSSFKVSTAGAEGVGRGSTFTHVHGSEVAFWEGASNHLTGLLQAVADAPGTEIILESTALGPSGVFYKSAMEALSDKDSEFEVIFIPWFWTDEYRREVSDEFKLSEDEKDYAETYGLDIEQMAWRRNKIKFMDRGISQFRQEYPATVEEAFMAEPEGALWTREEIKSISKNEWVDICETYDEVATVVAFDPAGGNVNDSNDESGIVVATLMSDDRVYVREDASGRYVPQKIVQYIINLYYRYEADRLTIETNGVGSWVPSTFQAEDKNIVIYPVYAKKGKKLRAHPVAQAYRRGEVVHVRDKNLSMLENEMCTWNPLNLKMRSPNRIDALVYAVTDLMDIDSNLKTMPLMWSSGRQ